MPRPLLKDRSSIIRQMVVPCLLAIAWFSFHDVPAFAAGLSSAELNQRGQEVANMTALERDRLQRNWQLYQKLPDERKQHYRQLHDQLEEDSKHGAKRLNHTMQTYSQWLQTLTPGQREDLRQAKSAAAKLDLVRKFKEDQEKQSQSHVLDEPAFDPVRVRRNFMQGKPLSTAELDAALNALVETLPPSERDAIGEMDKQKDKWNRYRRIITSSARKADGPRNWPDPEQQAAMLGAIKVTEQAKHLNAIKQERPRRIKFIQLIFSSLGAELVAEATPFVPKKDELETFYEQLLQSLDNSARDELLQLDAQRLHQELLRQYYLKHRHSDPAFRDFMKTQKEFQGFVGQFLRDAEVGGRFGPGGPGMDRTPPRDGAPNERGRPRPQ